MSARIAAVTRLVGASARRKRKEGQVPAMARRRYISTDISTDSRIAKLANEGGAVAALLYTWMIPHADEDGGLTADLDEIRAKVVPLFKLKPDTVTKAVALMVELGLIELSTDQRRYFFPAATFYKYQSNIRSENRRPIAENSTERHKTAQNATDEHETPQNSASVSLSLSSSVPVSVPVSAPASVSRASAPNPVALLEERPNIFKLYEQCFGRGVGGLISQRLLEYEREWPPDCVTHCFQEAAEAHARTATFVYAILDRHKAEGCYAKSNGANRSLAAAAAGAGGLAAGVGGMDERLARFAESRRHRAP